MRLTSLKRAAPRVARSTSCACGVRLLFFVLAFFLFVVVLAFLANGIPAAHVCHDGFLRSAGPTRCGRRRSSVPFYTTSDLTCVSRCG